MIQNPPSRLKTPRLILSPKKNTPSGARSQICGCICVHPLLHLRIHHCHAKKNGSSRRASALALAGHCGCTCQVSETWTARWNWRIFEGWGWWNLNGEKPLSEALPGFILVNIARQTLGFVAEISLQSSWGHKWALCVFFFSGGVCFPVV